MRLGFLRYALVALVSTFVAIATVVYRLVSFWLPHRLAGPCSGHRSAPADYPHSPR